MITIEPKKEEEKTGEGKSLKICFVCTGNTCRSPMAAAVANSLARERIETLPEGIRELAIPEIEAYSSGICANDGEEIAENAVRALGKAGVEPIEGKDYRRHKSHTLCEEEAERYDLLVGMTSRHAMMMLMNYPQLAGRITVMPEEIPDPYGGDEETYENCLGRITEAVRNLLFSGSGEKKD